MDDRCYETGKIGGVGARRQVTVSCRAFEALPDCSLAHRLCSILGGAAIVEPQGIVDCLLSIND
jgi:hypothetical protein